MDRAIPAEAFVAAFSVGTFQRLERIFFQVLNEHTVTVVSPLHSSKWLPLHSFELGNTPVIFRFFGKQI